MTILRMVVIAQPNLHPFAKSVISTKIVFSLLVRFAQFLFLDRKAHRFSSSPRLTFGIAGRLPSRHTFTA